MMEYLQFIKKYFKNIRPEIGIVLGSGLNDLLDSVDVQKVLPYENIPGFPRSTVSGHAGEFAAGKAAGKMLIAAKGRFHYYEGYDMDDILSIMKTFHALGIKHVVITNAAGLMNKDHIPGDILLIRDCIDMTGLTSAMHDDSAKISDKEKEIALRASKLSKVKIGEGVYVWTTGPSYETPAEIRYFSSLGGDLVGMSTMPEIIWARKHGMRVYPFSCATNWASGMSDQPLTHEEVNETAQKVRHDLTHYILTLCQLIGD
jgi:purine-nucleoside phosphorylase